MLVACSLLATSAAAFTPCGTPSRVSRQAVQTASPMMSAEDTTRRQLFARAGAALFGAAMVDSASAKAGQFGKIGIFGMEDLSSPYQPGGPKAGPDATFGYQKSDGEFLANGYEGDVSREKASFEESARRVSSLGPQIESKTWWLVRDNLRSQAYNMRGSMIAIQQVSPNKKAAEKAYKKFWTEIEQLDLACEKKELSLAQKEYADVLVALDGWKGAAF
jgi:hypothetical protein